MPRRSPLRAWALTLGMGLAVACAADRGDPVKSLQEAGAIEMSAQLDSGDDGYGGSGGSSSGSPTGGDDTGTGSSSGSSSSSSSAGSTTSASSGGSGSGSSTSSGSSGGSSSSSGSTSSSGSSGSSASSSGVMSGDGGLACLQNPPASCAICQTQNQSDATICKNTYLPCYIAHNCNPTTACGSMDAVCGVNTLGGGSAPQMAAIATYQCACP